MTDLYKMLCMLDNQVVNKDWPRCHYKVDRKKDDEITIHIKSEKLKFYFDFDENFVGICNYKD